MVFSSLEFLFRFLPIALLLYFIAPRKLKNPILLIASLFFYAWGEPIYVFLMIFSCLVNYALAIRIDKYRGTTKSKLALVASIVVSLALLGFFKYADFFIGNIVSTILKKTATYIRLGFYSSNLTSYRKR